VRLTFLGTGTSFGVPQVGCQCKVCKSPDPRDTRSRVGAMVESSGGTRVLIDTPPELRTQLIANNIDRVDAVLFTHDHADHTHGLDDIRAISVRRDGALPMYGAASTMRSLHEKFRYVFDDTMRPMPGTAKPEGESHVLEHGVPVTIGDLHVMPFAVPHGRFEVTAFRLGALGYVTDAKSVPASAIALLRGVRVLVLNALFRTSHPTHLSIPEAIAVARDVGAERTYFTHLTHENFHADLEAELPNGVSPAFDGLTVRVE
jgi:phosphoribosyl 1,2-cyclic phosphate phosphodiesterase